MQTHLKPVGKDGERTRVILTPDGSDPEDDRQPYAVSFEEGLDMVMLRPSSGSRDSHYLAGIDKIRHTHEALGEVLRRMEAYQAVVSDTAKR
jgi:hypothetical protein